MAAFKETEVWVQGPTFASSGRMPNLIQPSSLVHLINLHPLRVPNPKLHSLQCRVFLREVAGIQGRFTAGTSGRVEERPSSAHCQSPAPKAERLYFVSELRSLRGAGTLPGDGPRLSESLCPRGGASHRLGKKGTFWGFACWGLSLGLRV